ncbi:BspA family leucine-rich repeat surface protein [Flavobacterium sp.]|uniref:BspA family leucine-rich repeat surface protein n=1 Tax=Flavobacterium sp. TaxID=239 RepID=UPI0026200118|nr:BspA family leucine-rich repeat surface protein [Flavobacterium sp.]
MKKNYLLFIVLLTTYFTNAQAPFITTWQVSGSDLSITIPIIEDDNIPDNYTIDFGDGTILDNQSGIVSHTYATAGTYTVSLSGNFSKIRVSNGSNINASKLFTIEQWGDIQWTSMNLAFSGCVNLSINAVDVPDLSNVTNMSYMFSNCSSLNQSLNDWDVSNITNISYIFYHADAFNQPLSNWNVSNVTDMSYAFMGADSFNQSLNDWDVSNVTNMQSIFHSADAFNQPLNNWDVSNVTNMITMFSYAESFNQSIDTWNVSNVYIMAGMFGKASSFNQPLNSWDVSNVTDMAGMFGQASSFNQPLNNWNVSNVNDMDSMFLMASSFNQPLDNWDVSNVTNMRQMFTAAINFNQDISSWVYNESVVFGLPGYFVSSTTLDVTNYDALLNRFKELGLQDKWLYSTNLEYCDEDTRNYLINELGWNIDNDNLAEDCTADIPLLDENQISIYPNPVNDFLHIENKSDVVVERVIIYNLQGRELINIDENLSIIKVDNLSTGVYIVNLITDSGSSEYKLIKN